MCLGSTLHPHRFQFSVPITQIEYQYKDRFLCLPYLKRSFKEIFCIVCIVNAFCNRYEQKINVAHMPIEEMKHRLIE